MKLVDSKPFLMTTPGESSPSSFSKKVAEEHKPSSAWQREMEKAEMAAWLNQPAVLMHGSVIPPMAQASHPSQLVTGITAPHFVTYGVDTTASDAVALPPSSPADFQHSVEYQSPSFGAEMKSETLDSPEVNPASRPVGKANAENGESPRQTISPAVDASAVSGGAAGAVISVHPEQAEVPDLPSVLLPRGTPHSAIPAEGVNVTLAGAVFEEPAMGAVGGGPRPTTPVSETAQVGWLISPTGETDEWHFEPSEAEASASLRQVSKSEIPPWRVHAEWTKEGVQVWIGADMTSETLSPHLPQVMQQIQRWLSEQGAQLLSLVCNGRTVFQRGEKLSSEFLDHTTSLPTFEATMPVLKQTGQIPLPLHDDIERLLQRDTIEVLV